MKTPAHSLFAGTSLIAWIALIAAFGHAQAASLVTLNTTTYISSASNAVITAGTNPSLAVANGTAVTPTYSTSGTNNSVVLINGTLTSSTGNNALTINGNNAHNGFDNTTNVQVSGAVSAAGTGSAIVHNSTGLYNSLDIAYTSVVTGGTDATDAAILVNNTGASTKLAINNYGNIVGNAVGRSAILTSSTNTANIDVTNGASAIISATAAGTAVNLGAGASGYNNYLHNLGNITAVNGSAVVFSNAATTHNTFLMESGLISTNNAAMAAIDVSGVSSGYTSMRINGGHITGSDANGIAVSFSKSGDVLTINGGTITGKITTATSGNGSVQFSASSGFATESDMGAVTNKLGSIQFLSGSATINNNLYANQLAFSGATATLNTASVNAGTTSLSFSSGTLNLNSNTLNVGTGSVLTTTGSTSTIALTMNASANGKIVSAGTLTNDLVNTGGTITVAPTLSGFAATTGNKFVVLKGTSDTTGLALSSSSNNLFSTWSLQSATSGTDAYGNMITGNNVILTYTARTTDSMGLTNNQKNTINSSIMAAAPTTISTAINNLSTAGEAATAGDKLRSEINRGSIEGAMASLQGAQSTIEMRLDGLRSGISTGESLVGAGAWVQGFGFSGVQGARADANGYKAKAGGVTFGADKEITKEVRLGGSFTYGDTSVDETGVNTGNTLKIKSYQGTAYSSYQGTPWYVNGSFNFGFHNYDTKRLVAFTGFSDTASAKHNGFSYAFKADGGYPFDVNGVTLTPMVGFAYTQLNQDAYAETSANGSALSVGSLSSQSIKSSLGGKVSKSYVHDTYKATPEFRAAWLHEYDAKALSNTASYVDGGASFTTTEVKPESNSALIGIGFTLKTVGNVSFIAGYNAELNEKYVGHTGSLQVRYDF